MLYSWKWLQNRWRNNRHRFSLTHSYVTQTHHHHHRLEKDEMRGNGMDFSLFLGEMFDVTDKCRMSTKRRSQLLHYSRLKFFLTILLPNLYHHENFLWFPGHHFDGEGQSVLRFGLTLPKSYSIVWCKYFGANQTFINSRLASFCSRLRSAKDLFFAPSAEHLLRSVGGHTDLDVRILMWLQGSRVGKEISFLTAHRKSKKNRVEM